MMLTTDEVYTKFFMVDLLALTASKTFLVPSTAGITTSYSPPRETGDAT